MELKLRFYYSYAKVFPRPGESVVGVSFEAGPGGKGANQANQAARLGGSVIMIGRVGIALLFIPMLFCVFVGSISFFAFVRNSFHAFPFFLRGEGRASDLFHKQVVIPELF